LCLCPLIVLYAKRHLFEYEFRLFPSRHGTKGFDLELAEDIACRLDVPLFLLDVG
jgi:hypothetical protein